MKKKRIKNRQALLTEIKRLNELASTQEDAIRSDVEDIRESLNAKNILMNALESVTGLKFDRNNLFENGLSAGLFLLLRRYISKVETKAEDTVYEFADSIFERIRNFISKYMHVRKKYPEGKDEDTSAPVE